MATSKQLAGLVGPTIMAISASEALNFHIWAANIPSVTYLNGAVLLVAGLAIVRFHNRWVRDWIVLITLLGWILLFAGLYRMFFPEAPQAQESSALYAGLAALFATGIFLTYKAYSRGDSEIR